ncbi:ATP-binding cassette domain-containing protein [Collinsella sp. AGMB00827]|uniref:ATP-binding cassette domain-containing protein n=1 Tax=Collinsella ureilytica TaxID=2869515 RepID=A0ABS7MIR3_9ACTN|nr:ATP-binding cassette domain-containing protein [Collinsella urealyticum]MBY4797137.1 ATP-binding cassette domain-containing protein [Collinsella urealyticum]
MDWVSKTESFQEPTSDTNRLRAVPVGQEDAGTDAAIVLTDARVSMGDVQILDGVSFTLCPGELVALAGENGSGKTTLARLAAATLVSDAGTVRICGMDPAATRRSRARARRFVASVAQDPTDHIVAETVLSEVAFTPINRGCAESEVRERVTAALKATGLLGFEEREVWTLSGGELVCVAIAGALAERSRFLVLDEVTAMLDPALRTSIFSMVKRLAHDEGLGVLLVTHNPYEMVAADRVVVLDRGKIAFDGRPEKLLSHKQELWDRIAGQGHAARERAASVCAAPTQSEEHRAFPSSGSLLEMRDVSFFHNGSKTPALAHITLTVAPGEILLIIGPSGSGKSSLAALAAGLRRPSSGEVLIAGAPAMPGCAALAQQRPESQFFLETVREEISYAPLQAGYSSQNVADRMVRAVEAAQVPAALLDRDPFSLSGGQQRRVCLASALAQGSDVYIFDEPTAGMDASGAADVHRLARQCAHDGAAVLVVSHDVDEWLNTADRVGCLCAGQLAFLGTTDEYASLIQEAGSGVDTPAFVGRASLPIALSASNPLLAPAPAPSMPAQHVHGAHTSTLESERSLPALPTVRVSVLELEGTSSKRSSAYRAVLARSQSLMSGSHPLDARVKLALFICMLVLVLVAPIPLLVLSLIPLGVLLLASATQGSRILLPLPALGIAILALVANLVSCDGSASVAVYGPVGLDPHAALRCAHALLRLGIVLGWAQVVARTTRSSDLADAAVELVSPVLRRRSSVVAVRTMVSIALTTMPLVAREYTRIGDTQRSRGAPLDRGSLLGRIAAHSAILIPLTSGLWRRADRLAASMEARGFDPARPAVSTPLPARDRRILVAGLIASIILLMLVLVIR